MFRARAVLAIFPRPASSTRWLHSTPSVLLFKKKVPPIVPTEPEIQLDLPVKESTEPLDREGYNNHPILKRIPRIFRPYTTQFIHAPISHVTAFLILHELTAIVPLAGVWYVLHEHHDLFMSASLDLPTWAIEKGTKIIDKAMVSWDFGDYSISEKVRFITEGAYAYVIVKALFPIRLAFSLLGMPWFAKWFVLPFTRVFSRKKTSPKVAEEHKPKQIKMPRL